MLKFGRICDNQEPNAKTLGRVRVNFGEDEMVSAWIPLLFRDTKANSEFEPIGINSFVACLMDEQCENGVVLGSAYTDLDATPEGTALTVWQKIFSDGSFWSYDITSHKFAFKTPSGTFQFNDGALGGLVSVVSLVSKINAIEEKINLIQVWGASVTPPFTGIPIVPTLRTEIEDTKVTH